MDKHTALQALSLDDNVSAEDIEQAYQEKRALIDHRIANSSNAQNQATLIALSMSMKKAKDVLLATQVEPELEQTDAVNADKPPKAEDELDIDVSADIQQFMKSQGRADRRRHFFWLFFVIIPLVIGVAWYTGVLQNVWEQYRPMSEQEKAAYASAINLQADIEQRKESLTAARIILQQQVQKAEEEQTEELPILQETLLLGDKSVFNSPKQQALQQQQTIAQEQFEKHEYVEAERAYRKVQTGYQELEQTYEEVKIVPVRRAATQSAQKEWRSLQEEYSLKAPQQAEEAEKSWQQAEQKKEQEAYRESTEDYDDAKEKYLAAQIAVADEVARLKARMLASREARLKKWRKKLSWLRSITPTMVKIPAGSFTMGDAKGDKDAQPEHTVKLPAFKLSRYEIPVRRFEQFTKQTGYKTQAEHNTDGLGCAVYNADGSWGWEQGYHWKNVGFTQTPLDPAVCITWNDASAYIQWLNKMWEGKRTFRLVSEAEWEYAARAGGRSKYPMGSSLGNNKTVCDGCGSIWDVKRTAPIDSFALNKFKLHAMPGNVWEWTMDCWHDGYQGAPSNGSAWVKGGSCQRRVLRGGSWFNKPQYLESAYRGSNKLHYRGNNLGFRVAETLKAGAKDYDIEE